MNQINRAIYVVDAGEVVTVQIIATLVGEFDSLVLDGTPLSPISTAPMTYRFTVTVPPGTTHFGTITCFFPKTAPDEAHYQTRLSSTGAAGPSGPFDGSDIYKTDPVWTRPLEFRRL
jgi:hypothetical protein